MEAKLKELLAEVEALEKISEEQEEEYRKASQFKCYLEGFSGGSKAAYNDIGDKLKKLIQQTTDVPKGT